MRVRVWQCFCRSAFLDIRRVISSLFNDFRIDCTNERDTWHKHLITFAFLSLFWRFELFLHIFNRVPNQQTSFETGKMNDTGNFVIFGPKANCTLDVRFLKSLLLTCTPSHIIEDHSLMFTPALPS